MEILLASNNAHKKDELRRILEPHTVLLPSEIGLNFHADETGSDYLENAGIKAQVLFESSGGRIVLADDSGLSVPALGGAPGIYSARYGSIGDGIDLEAGERNALLLENMKDIPDDAREAFFVCCMVLITGEYRRFSVQETFNGVIARTPSGSGGFGYDPIFFLPELDKTVSELSAEEKDGISHRGRAGIRMKAILDSLETTP